jgi:hypothetical protein
MREKTAQKIPAKITSIIHRESILLNPAKPWAKSQ